MMVRIVTLFLTLAFVGTPAVAHAAVSGPLPSPLTCSALNELCAKSCVVFSSNICLHYCQTSRDECMQTGIFKDVDRSIPNVEKR